MSKQRVFLSIQDISSGVLTDSLQETYVRIPAQVKPGAYRLDKRSNRQQYQEFHGIPCKIWALMRALYQGNAKLPRYFTSTIPTTNPMSAFSRSQQAVPVESMIVAQAATAATHTPATQPTPQTATARSMQVVASVPPPAAPTPNWWMYATFGLSGILILLGITSYLQSRKLEALLTKEKQRAQQLKYHVKKRGETIVKMEKNPDLVNSRDFNLDYLRMRMAEEVFHFEIVSQIKTKVREKISIALRPKQVANGELGIASKSGRQIDEIFDVIYKTEDHGPNRVLFRVGVRLVKLPTQPTSVTINQLIDCLETFLSPTQEHDTWQPTIQGRLAYLCWDQKAKPTPLLLIEQTQEGANVTFRTQRAAAPPVSGARR